MLYFLDIVYVLLFVEYVIFGEQSLQSNNAMCLENVPNINIFLLEMPVLLQVIF